MAGVASALGAARAGGFHGRGRDTDGGRVPAAEGTAPPSRGSGREVGDMAFRAAARGDTADLGRGGWWRGRGAIVEDLRGPGQGRFLVQAEHGAGRRADGSDGFRVAPPEHPSEETATARRRLEHNGPVADPIEKASFVGEKKARRRAAEPAG